MSTDSPQDLLKAWHAETLKMERAIGQLLQHSIKLYDEQKVGQERRGQIQRAVEANAVSWANLKNEMVALQAQVQHVNTRLDQLEDHLGLPPLKVPGRRGRPPKGMGKSPPPKK